jgi:probable rRNA maturation factor
MEPGEGRPTLLFRGLKEPWSLSAEHKRTLKQFARELAVQVAQARVFTCLITSDRELRRLNSEFLHHDYATDVLSFPAITNSSELGELAISAERAHVQAKRFGHSLIDEIRVLMLHGLLHLMGFDHEGDRGQMARAERKWRGAFDLPQTLISRVRNSMPSSTR